MSEEAEVEKPVLWVALNNYADPRTAIGRDRELLAGVKDYYGIPSDYNRPLELAKDLDYDVDGNYGWKLNADLLDAAGFFEHFPDVIGKLQELDRPIFADIKMNKGGGTMAREAETLSDREVEYTNAYCGAGELLQRAAAEDVSLIGLTVKTHHPDEFYEKRYRRSKEETVRMLSKEGYENGCDGLLVPPTAYGAFDVTEEVTVGELEKIKEEMYFVSPGIRPDWDTRADKNEKQSQKATPREAIENGADALVIGSPIYKAQDYSEDGRRQSEALESILEEIESV